jgi:hypothetical protein
MIICYNFEYFVNKKLFFNSSKSKIKSNSKIYKKLSLNVNDYFNITKLSVYVHFLDLRVCGDVKLL